MKKVGIFIIILGLALTVFTAFSYFTREKVLNIGTVEITANKTHHVNWSPLVGIAVIGVGGIVFWQGSKR